MSLSKIFIRPVTFRATEDAVSASSVASVNISGGLSIKKSTYISENLVTSGTATFSNTVTINAELDLTGRNVKNLADPVDPLDAINKTYFDSKMYDPAQSHITSIGTLTGLSVAGPALFTNTADSTSPIHGGSALFSGGIGVKSTLWVGGIQGIKMSDTVGPMLTKDVNRFTSGLYTNTGRSGLFFESGDWVTLATANLGSSVFNGVQFGGYNADSTLTSWMTIWSHNGTVSIKGTADSISVTTGVLQVAGGVGISKSLYVGDSINASNTITGKTLVSTSAVDGDVLWTFNTDRPWILKQVGAGVSSSIGFMATVGGNKAFIIKAYNNSDCFIVNTGAADGVGSFINLNTLKVTVTNSTDSTSATTGVLLVNGGIGVAKNAGFGNALWIGANSATWSSSHTKGIYMRYSTAVGQDSAFIQSIDRSVAALTAYPLVIEASSISFNCQASGIGVQQVLINPSGMKVLNATDSTSLTTGALQINGGGYVAKSLTIGGNLRLFGTTSGFINLKSPPTATTYTLTFPNAAPSTAGSYIVSDASGNLSFAASVSSSTGSFTDLIIQGTTDVTAANTGALQVSGGAWIGNKLHVGGWDLSLGTTDQITRGDSGASRALVKLAGATLVINYAGDFPGGTRVDSILKINNITDSTSVTTGALQVAGGAAFDKNVTIGGNLSMTGSTPRIAGNSSTGPLEIDPNFTTNNFVKVWDDLRVWGDFRSCNTAGSLSFLHVNSTNGEVIINTSTDSTSVTTGAFQVAGGAGIKMNLTVGGYLVCNNEILVRAKTALEGGQITLTYPGNYSAIIQSNSSWFIDVYGSENSLRFVDINAAGSVRNALQIKGTTGEATFSSELILSTDNYGITFFGGGRIYKKFGGGMTMVPHHDTLGYTFTNTAQTANWLTLNSTAVTSVVPFTVSSTKSVGNIARTEVTLGTGAFNLTGDMVIIASSKIIFGDDGVAGPTFTTRSAGTKIVLYPSVGASLTDYALGMANSTMWFSVEDTSRYFRWYGGTTLVMQLATGGALSITNMSTTNSTPLHSLTPALATGNYTQFGLGVASSTNNTFEMRFYYVGAGLATNYALLSFWGNATTGLKIVADGTVSIPVTTDSTSTTTGALQVAGGVGIGKTLNAGISSTGIHVLQTTSSSDILRLHNLSNTGYAAIQMMTPSNTLFFGLGGSTSSAPYVNNAYLTAANSTNFILNTSISTVQILSATTATSTTTGALQVRGGAGISGPLYVGGVIYPSSTINMTNPLTFDMGTSPPTTGTRSSGTRISLWSDLHNTNFTEYALGIESSTMWYSVSSSGAHHKWYAGTTRIMQLTGTGSLYLSPQAADTVGHLVVDRPVAGGLGGTITVRNTSGKTVNTSAALAFEIDNSTAFDTSGGFQGNAELRCINVGGANAASNLVFTLWNGVSHAVGMTIQANGETAFGSVGTKIGSTYYDIGDSVVGARWRIHNGNYHLNFSQNDGSGNYIMRSWINNSTGAFNGPIVSVANAPDGYVGWQMRNTNAGTNAFGYFAISNDLGTGGTVLFMNSSTRTNDIDANAACLRNDLGDMWVQAKGGGGRGIKVSADTNIVNITTTTDSTSTTSGAFQVAGGASIRKNLYVGGIQQFDGMDSVSTTLLNENFSSAPIGTLSGNAIWADGNHVRLQAAGQQHSSGTLTYTIASLGRYWTLSMDIYYGTGNDEGFEIRCGAWVIAFNSWNNFTRITSPEGTNPATVPGLTLARNVWQPLKIQLVYDILYVYVSGTLRTSLQSRPSTGTVHTNATLSIRGISGGYSSTKSIDNLLLTRDSNGTTGISFSPLSFRGTSSQIIAVDDNSYGSQLSFRTVTGMTGSPIEQMRIQSGNITMYAPISFPTSSLAANGLSFGSGTNSPFSRIYDDSQLHIWTDDNMYFDVGGAIGSTNAMHISTSHVAIYKNVYFRQTAYFETERWHRSTDDVNRLHFAANHRTYFGSKNGYEWRNAADGGIGWLEENGNFTASGDITAFSDARLKKDISTLDNATELVKKMRGVSFTRKENGEKGIGMIAQELQDILPEVVHVADDPQGTLSVAYGNIVGVLVEAIKDLIKRVEAMEAAEKLM